MIERIASLGILILDFDELIHFLIALLFFVSAVSYHDYLKKIQSTSVWWCSTRLDMHSLSHLHVKGEHFSAHC